MVNLPPGSHLYRGVRIGIIEAFVCVREHRVRGMTLFVVVGYLPFRRFHRWGPNLVGDDTLDPLFDRPSLEATVRNYPSGCALTIKSTVWRLRVENFHARYCSIFHDPVKVYARIVRFPVGHLSVHLRSMYHAR